MSRLARVLLVLSAINARRGVIGRGETLWGLAIATIGLLAIAGSLVWLPHIANSLTVLESEMPVSEVLASIRDLESKIKPINETLVKPESATAGTPATAVAQSAAAAKISATELNEKLGQLVQATAALSKINEPSLTSALSMISDLKSQDAKDISEEFEGVATAVRACKEKLKEVQVPSDDASRATLADKVKLTDNAIDLVTSACDNAKNKIIKLAFLKINAESLKKLGSDTGLRSQLEICNRLLTNKTILTELAKELHEACKAAEKASDALGESLREVRLSVESVNDTVESLEAKAQAVKSIAVSQYAPAFLIALAAAGMLLVTGLRMMAQGIRMRGSQEIGQDQVKHRRLQVEHLQSILSMREFMALPDDIKKRLLDSVVAHGQSAKEEGDLPRPLMIAILSEVRRLVNALSGK